MGLKIRSHCVEKAAIWSGVNMPEWNFNVCNLQVNSIATIQSMSINYHSLLKRFHILINNSLKHVNVVIFKSVAGI